MKKPKIFGFLTVEVYKFMINTVSQISNNFRFSPKIWKLSLEKELGYGLKEEFRLKELI